MLHNALLLLQQLFVLRQFRAQFVDFGLVLLQFFQLDVQLLLNLIKLLRKYFVFILGGLELFLLEFVQRCVELDLLFDHLGLSRWRRLDLRVALLLDDLNIGSLTGSSLSLLSDCLALLLCEGFLICLHDRLIDFLLFDEGLTDLIDEPLSRIASLRLLIDPDGGMRRSWRGLTALSRCLRLGLAISVARSPAIQDHARLTSLMNQIELRLALLILLLVLAGLRRSIDQILDAAVLRELAAHRINRGLAWLIPVVLILAHRRTLRIVPADESDFLNVLVDVAFDR